MQLEKLEPAHLLPQKLYRGLLMLTCAWAGERVAEGSLLIKVWDVPNATKQPLIWCGGSNEMPALLSVFGAERTIYGLRGTYEFVEPTNEVICNLGQYYANEIVRSIPAAPYLIAGNCAAAYIAIELAEILTQQGHEVGFLGLVERDVTEQSMSLKLVRKVYSKIDRLGTITTDTYNAAHNQSLGLRAVKLAKHLALKLNIAYKKSISDPRAFIRYQSESHDKLYQLKPYNKKISLIFVSWGVFGFYRFNFFQKYWRKIAPSGITVDIVKGFSHAHPPWLKIIECLHRRILDAGL